MPSKKKRPAPLDLSAVQQEGTTTLSATLSTMAYQPKKKKRGPYDPEVYHAIEQIRQQEEVKRPITKRKKREPPQEAIELLEQLDQDAAKLDQAIQQNSPVKAEGYQLVDEGEDPPHICPFHMSILFPVDNSKGYQLSKCNDQPCLISVFNNDNATSYLHGVYHKVHKDIHDHWEKLVCGCGFLPGLRQSKSENNLDRMYLACRHHKCKFFRWADQPLADPEDVMTCPCHLEKMEERTAKSGWQYLRCPAWTCFLFCGKTNGEKYMSAVRKNIHPDICERWEKITCLCGSVPVLKQSASEKNPDRLYLACGDKRCEFFRWADTPIDKENFKDPLAVQDWLHTIPDLGESNNGKEIRPPIYGEGLAQAEQRVRQTKLGRQEIVEVDPPVYVSGEFVDPYQTNFEKDYVPLHQDVLERGKLGLF